ncbi:MAG: outer membrane beta-barrel protein, partial [Thermonemataceae bacterium]|nr:outer membrane beta-barrel protein [Thermonemataceae bacterium]
LINIYFLSFGQNLVIKGIVKNNMTKQGIAHFPFKLYQMKIDSTNLIGDYLSDDKGDFSITIAEKSKLYWVANNLSYYPLVKEIVKIQNSTIDLGEILVEQKDTIQGIEVRAATVETDAQKVIFNVGVMGLPENIETQMVLKMTPMLSMGQENEYKVMGTKGVLFYLNGQRTTKEVIESLPSEAIDKIEVIPNPPISELAGKNAIINVVIKSNAFISKGSINSIAGFFRPMYAGNINFMLKNKKTMLNFTTGATQVSIEGAWDMNRKNTANFMPISQEGKTFTNTQTSNTSFSFFHNINNTLKINGELIFFLSKPFSSNQIYLNNFINNSIENTTNNSEIKQPLLVATTEIKKMFSKKYSSSIILNLSTNQNNSSLINTKNQYIANSTNEQNVKTWAGKWSNHIHLTNHHKLNIGFIYAHKYSKINFVSMEANLNTGDTITIGDNTGFQNFKQNLVSGFIGYNFSYRSWIFNFEGRAEYLERNLQDATLNENSYFTNLLPQISITRELGSYGNMSLLYRRVIYRPDAESFNTFKMVNNPSIFSRGDNNLMNEIENEFALNYAVNLSNSSFFSTSINYNRLDKAIVYRTISSDSIFEKKYENIIFYDNLQLNVSYNNTIKERFIINISSLLNAYNYKSIYSDNAFSQGLTYQLDASVTYLFKKNWIGFFSVSYLTKDVQYQAYKKKPPLIYWNVSKSFFQEKISISLGVGDVFNWNGQTLEKYNDGAFKQESNNYLKSGYIDISFRYNFGKKFQDMRKIEGIKIN